MKKLSYLLGLLIVGSLIFSACNKDEDEEPQDLTPTIAFAGGGTDTTIVAGDSIIVSVACTSNPISGKKLASYKIYMIADNVTGDPIVEITDIDNNAYAVAYYIIFEEALTGKLYAKN